VDGWELRQLLDGNALVAENYYFGLEGQMLRKQRKEQPQHNENQSTHDRQVFVFPYDFSHGPITKDRPFKPRPN
jgi:hypothetical protein